MDATLTPEARAERGALFLDGYMPDWFEKINIDALDINDSDNCVAGQLFAEHAREKYDDCTSGFYYFHTHVMRHGLDLHGFASAVDLDPEYTFMNQLQEFADLGAAWACEIVMRRVSAESAVA